MKGGERHRGEKGERIGTETTHNITDNRFPGKIDNKNDQISDNCSKKSYRL